MENFIYSLMCKREWVLISLFLIGLVYPKTAFSQSGDSLKVDRIDPNTVPYKTERSIGHHILAAPSYLLHWVSRPVGYGVKYAEEHFPHWFKGERGPYGFLPLIEVGGEEGFAAGALLYHDHLFFKDHRARSEILFGSQVYNEFDLEYRVPVKGVENGNLTFDAEYENAPQRSYYAGNHDEDLSYASEFGGIEVTYRQQVNRWLRTRVNAGYRNTTVKTSMYEDDIQEQVPSSLLGKSQLFSVGNRWILNHKNRGKRTLNGTQYELGGNWTQSAETHSLSFIEYYGAIHHFVPLPVLPETRRLGLKMQMRKQHNLASRDIPFYELNSLGGTHSLRGFPSNRFRAEGTLQLTAEYRYPVWDFLDMVIFIDEGQPFDSYGDISLGDFRSSYGFGFHLLSANGLAFRSEFAFSKEGGRFIISITPNF